MVHPTGKLYIVSKDLFGLLQALEIWKMFGASCRNKDCNVEVIVVVIKIVMRPAPFRGPRSPEPLPEQRLRAAVLMTYGPKWSRLASGSGQFRVRP